MRGWGKAPGFIHMPQSGSVWPTAAFNGWTECTLLRGFKDVTRYPLMAFYSTACQTWIRLQNTVFQPLCLCQVSEFKRLEWTPVLFPSLLEAPIDGLWAPAKEETQLLSKRRAPPTTSQAHVYTSRCLGFWKQPSFLSAATGVNSQAAADFLCVKVASFQCGLAVVLLFFLLFLFYHYLQQPWIFLEAALTARYQGLAQSIVTWSHQPHLLLHPKAGRWAVVDRRRIDTQCRRVQQTIFKTKSGHKISYGH